MAAGGESNDAGVSIWRCNALPQCTLVDNPSLCADRLINKVQDVLLLLLLLQLADQAELCVAPCEALEGCC